MYQSIAQCPNLERVWLPASLEEMDIAHTYRIAVGSKTLQDIEFVVVAGSYAENYCLSYGLRIAYQ